MELKDFISETLVQIANGITDANQQLENCDAMVNPPNVSVSTSSDKLTYGVIDTSKDSKESSWRQVQKIDFDVSVTATKGSGTNGGIKIGIGGIGLGSEGKSESENQASNRIKFTIPMVLPYAQNKI